MKPTTIIGIILILLGILFLGPTFGLFSLKTMWPAVLLLIGVGFFISYAAAPAFTGFLMPASVLVVSSILFFMCTFSNNWYQLGYLWPIFIFSVSLGNFLMYFLGKKELGLLIAAVVLLGVGSISFLILNYIDYIFPILFLTAGLVLVFIGLTGQKKNKKVNSDANSEQSNIEK